MERDDFLWLEFAKTDLGVAKHLNTNYYPKPLEIICYHCQQAAEKSIKAVIHAYGAQGGMPKKHNLSFLLQQMKNMIDIDEKYYDYADVLTPYGIAVRYPNEILIEERNVEEAIRYAEEFVQWADTIVSKKDVNTKD